MGELQRPAVTELEADILVDGPATPRPVLAPIDVVVGTHFEPCDWADLEPDRLRHLGVHFTAVVVTNETDRVDVVGEAIAQMRIAHVKMAGR